METRDFQNKTGNIERHELGHTRGTPGGLTQTQRYPMINRKRLTNMETLMKDKRE